MRKKVFIFGDSCTADIAGAQIPDLQDIWDGKKVKLEDYKKIIIDDLDFTFCWQIGAHAAKTYKDHTFLDSMINIVPAKIDEESLVFLYYGGMDVEQQFFPDNDASIVVDSYFNSTQNFFKKITPNVFYIEVSGLAEVTHGALKKLLPKIPNEQRTKNWMDFTTKLKEKCTDNNILEPFSIGLETFGSLTRITGIDTPDGYHFYRHKSELIRLDLAKWIKKNKQKFAKTTLETWSSMKYNGPYDEDLSIYEI